MAPPVPPGPSEEGAPSTGEHAREIAPLPWGGGLDPSSTRPLGPYAPGAPQYPHCKGKKFLCSNEPNSEAPENDFNECLEAIDCQMHQEMAVSAEGATMAATFLRQMIPHHANAVAMANTLLKMDPGTVDTEATSPSPPWTPPP